MDKKAFMKLGLLILVGMLIGVIARIGLLTIEDIMKADFFEDLISVLKFNSIYISIILFVLVFIPSYIYYLKGSKMAQLMSSASEDDLDEIQEKNEKYFNISITSNAVYFVLNFMLLGIAFDSSHEYFYLILVIFLFSVILSSILTVTVVKRDQKTNPHLKGDPMSSKFSRDYIKSCDEAEKLVIYKASYKAFNSTISASIIFVLVAVVMNMLFETGGFAVLLTGSMMIYQILSVAYFSVKKDRV